MENRLTKNSLVFRSLSVVYLFVLLFSAIDPLSRAVWMAEIIPAILIYVGIFLISRTYTFSNTAYSFMFVWLILHTIGSKYTFSEVPCEWFNQIIGSERNNFDRLAHFSIGFYAYPIAEYLIKKNLCSPLLGALFGLTTVMSIAAGYEIIEWWYAELAGGDEGVAFLGSQGDVWDAQKDMLCDTSGAILSLAIMKLQGKLA